MEGSLLKQQPGLLNKWRKYRATLTGQILALVPHQQGGLRSPPTLNVDGAQIKIEPAPQHCSAYNFTLTGKTEVWHLAAPDENSLRKWYAALLASSGAGECASTEPVVTVRQTLTHADIQGVSALAAEQASTEAALRDKIAELGHPLHENKLSSIIRAFVKPDGASPSTILSHEFFETGFVHFALDTAGNRFYVGEFVCVLAPEQDHVAGLVPSPAEWCCSACGSTAGLRG